MAPKEAVTAAKDIFLELVGEAPTLEEIWFDDKRHEWCVTFGIRRRTINTVGNIMGAVQSRELIDYKVVRISDADGTFVSIRNRDDQRAA